MEAHHIRIPVSATPAAAASARRQLADGIRAFGASLGSELLDAAELVAAELIANAVRHANGGPITAGACLSDKGLRIEVNDANPAVPQVGLSDVDEEGGRGLFLVAALADRHGFDPLPPGKRCWAEFKVSTSLPTTSHQTLQRS